MAADTNQSGASQQHITRSARMQSTLEHHQMVAVSTLSRLLTNPIASMLTWLVIAISLTLPGALWMAVDNLQQLSGRFQESGRITVYLQHSVGDTRARALNQTINNLPNVSNTQYIDARTALDEFQRTSGMSDVLALLPDNPLPAMILVEPPLGISPQDSNQLATKLRTLKGVEDVQMDMAWVERLLAMLALGERIVLILGCLLALAILLVVGNTIRLAIAARVDEIRIVKLVGGTNAYVRRPFLYTGLWYGFVGGLMSWVLLATCWALINGPVDDFALLYGSNFYLKPLSAGAALVLLLSAMLLGWLGAWWSVARHLHRIEP